jgi:hypothetical protein
VGCWGLRSFVVSDEKLEAQAEKHGQPANLYIYAVVIISKAFLIRLK